MKDTGGSAYPIQMLDMGSGPADPELYGMAGITLRNYFAIRALQGALAGEGGYTESNASIQAQVSNIKLVERAYLLADIMITESYR